MTYAGMVSKAEAAAAKVSRVAKFDTYLNMIQLLWRADIREKGIWLFFSFDNSVLAPGMEESARIPYQSWRELRSQVSVISTEMGWMQGGNSYRV